MYPSELDKAWAAGILDGEGCISISKENHTDTRAGLLHRPRVRVQMTHELTVRRLRDLFGGHILTVDGASVGRKMSWDWRLRHPQQVSTFLRGVLPYMVTKREEAILLLDALLVWGERTVGPGRPLTNATVAIRDAYYWALREAKAA